MLSFRLAVFIVSLSNLIILSSLAIALPHDSILQVIILQGVVNTVMIGSVATDPDDANAYRKRRVAVTLSILVAIISATIGGLHWFHG